MSTQHLGWYRAGSGRSHVRFIFTTNASTGGNVAPNSAFEAADIRIYRAQDGAAHSATQRSSASGITMTSPFDSLTGVHEVDIDLTDNTDAGFYATGYFYTVVLAPDETVDGQTITGAVLATFDIISRGMAPVDMRYIEDTDASDQVTALCSTAITNYNLDQLLYNSYDPTSPPGSSGSVIRRLTENDAGALRFNAEALEQAPTGGSAPTAADIADAVWDEALSGHLSAGSTGEALSNAGSAGTPPTAAAIADAVWDEATAGHTTSGTFGEQLKTDVDAILADTNELQTDLTNGGRLDLLIDAILADTNELQTDITNGGRVDLLIDAILADTNELQTDWANGGRLDLLIDSIITSIGAIGTAPTAAANAQAAATLSLVDVEDSLPKYSMGAFAMAFLRFSRSGGLWSSFKPSDGDPLHTYSMTTADAELVTAVTP